MDILKNLTAGLNLKNSILDNDLLKLKRENLKPLKPILKLAKIEERYWKSDDGAESTTDEEQEHKRKQEKGNKKKSEEYNKETINELIPFKKFYKDENTVTKYLKQNEINIEYYNINKRVVPLRQFEDLTDYLDLLREEKEEEREVENEEDKEEEKEGKKKKERKENEKKRTKTVIAYCNKLLNIIKFTLHYENPRPIQKICIPAILNGFNTICISQTGSGKTAAFLIPILIKLNEMKMKKREKNRKRIEGIEKDKEEGDNKNIFFIRSLIVVPTSELAFQIVEQGKLLINACEDITIFQLREEELKSDIEICISTPAPLIYFLKKKKNLHLNECKYIVFDEVDKLFEMNFFNQTYEILKEIKNMKMQKIFSTATLPGKVKEFINTLCLNHVIVYFGKNINLINENVKQELLYVNSEEEKLLVLHNILKNKEIRLPIIIFVNSIAKAKGLYTSLKKYFCNVDIITSEQTKEKRLEAFKKLKEGTTWYLICTDLMSRGIDIPGIEVVINYDICYDKYNYMHRIGRACRSNRKEGKAITMYTPENIKYMKHIVKFVKNSGASVPDFLMNAKFLHNVRKEYVENKKKKNKGKKRTKKEGDKINKAKKKNAGKEEKYKNLLKNDKDRKKGVEKNTSDEKDGKKQKCDSMKKTKKEILKKN